jgi:hypothetical protein
VLWKKNDQHRTVGERKEKNGVVLRLICVKKKKKFFNDLVNDPYSLILVSIVHSLNWWSYWE